jgi:hypothetical protein
MDIAFTTSGENVLTTYLNEGEIENRNISGLTFKDKQPKDHEKLFGMTEDMIYKKFGLYFTETRISINGRPTYKIESDHDAMLWLIRKGFVTYHKGKERWNNQALDEGWENGWTPNPDSIVEKKKEYGHVYFFKSANSYKVGCSCESNIKNRVRQQLPDEVLAVSPARDDYKVLEKKIHKMFAKNRVARYEIFNDLTEKEVQKIKKMLGNKIAVKIKLRGER